MIRCDEELRVYLYADQDAVARGSAPRSEPADTSRTRYTRLLRRAEYYTNCRKGPAGRMVALFLRLRLKTLGRRLQLAISLNSCGPGLRLLGHRVVVDRGASLGYFCTLEEGATVRASGEGSPTIGHQVHIGRDVEIVGNVTVGAGAQILEGARVRTDIPSRALVVGVPAVLPAPRG